jgi:hypothetical protein
MKNKKRQISYLKIVGEEYSDGKNIFPKEMSDTEFRKLITKYILGENWYTVNPVCQEQCNVYMAIGIIEKINIKRCLNER